MHPYDGAAVATDCKQTNKNKQTNDMSAANMMIVERKLSFPCKQRE